MIFVHVRPRDLLRVSAPRGTGQGATLAPPRILRTKRDDFEGVHSQWDRVFTVVFTGCSQGVHGCSRVFTTSLTVSAHQFYVGFLRISPNDIGCSIATDTPFIILKKDNKCFFGVVEMCPSWRVTAPHGGAEIYVVTLLP